MKILIADDHAVLRAGLRAMLNSEPDMSVVGEVDNGSEVLEKVRLLQPDMLLLDINMPGLNGIEVTRQVMEAYPQVKVLFLTIHEDISLMKEALRIGAVGYVPKRAVETEVIHAVRRVSRGELYIHSSMARALLVEDMPEPDKSPEITLTLREIDVLRLISRGYTNRQIGDELNLSVRTVESYRASLMNKLGLHSRVELVKYASEKGLT